MFHQFFAPPCLYIMSQLIIPHVLSYCNVFYTTSRNNTVKLVPSRPTKYLYTLNNNQCSLYHWQASFRVRQCSAQVNDDILSGVFFSSRRNEIIWRYLPYSTLRHQRFVNVSRGISNAFNRPRQSGESDNVDSLLVLFAQFQCQSAKKNSWEAFSRFYIIEQRSSYNRLTSFENTRRRNPEWPIAIIVFWGDGMLLYTYRDGYLCYGYK